MSAIAFPQRLEWTSAADHVLKASARFWFLVAFIGQWAFLYYIVAVYGTTTVQGNFPAWARNTLLLKGYVEGDTAGNLAFAAHALLAGIISFGGTIQLLPWIRRRAMAVHRWNGRLFLTTALGVSITGLYMVWVRGAQINTLASIAISIDAALIIIFAIITWRSARAHDATAHRRWALRTFLVANGQWFFRVGLIAWLIINRGPAGSTEHLDGPFDLFWMFGNYLVPLAVLEIYHSVKEHAGPRGKLAMAGAMFMITIVMSIGIAGVYWIFWRPILARF
jgi:hypothetical protein